MTFIDTLSAVIESENLDAYLDLEAYEAYGDNLGLAAEDFADWQEEAEEAYAGQFPTDEDFAQDLAKQIGAIDTNAGWPNSYIDWERAARDLMMDFFNTYPGYYFRNM